MNQVPTTNELPEPRPWFVTSLRECSIVFYIAWTCFLGAAYESGPFTLRLAAYFPSIVAHWGAACLFAIPITIGSLFFILCMYLTDLPAIDKYLPVVWLRSGKPRFVGAMFWAFVQAITIGAFCFLASFET